MGFLMSDSESEEEEEKEEKEDSTELIETSETSETKSEKSFNRRTLYKCFCCHLDKRAALFFSQLALTLILLGFCFSQIYSQGNANSGPVWGLIGTFIGFWFDSPKLKEND